MGESFKATSCMAPLTDVASVYIVYSFLTLLIVSTIYI